MENPSSVSTLVHLETVDGQRNLCAIYGICFLAPRALSPSLHHPPLPFTDQCARRGGGDVSDALWRAATANALENVGTHKAVPSHIAVSVFPLSFRRLWPCSVGLCGRSCIRIRLHALLGWRNGWHPFRRLPAEGNRDFTACGSTRNTCAPTLACQVWPHGVGSR